MTGHHGHLRRLLADESAAGGVLPSPDYARLAELAVEWRAIWDELLAAGGGSGVVRALVAGIREPEAQARLIALARPKQSDLLLRQAAVTAIGRTAAAGAEDLLLELCDADRPIRRQAARELARLGSPWAWAALSMELASGDEAAVAALAEQGDPVAVARLRERLEESGDPLAAELLGALAVSSAVPGLFGLLYDARPEHRLIALAALAEIGDPRAMPFMIGCLDDEDDEVRAAATAAVSAVAGVRPSSLEQAARTDAFIAAATLWWRRARLLLRKRLCFHHGRRRTVGHWIAELAETWAASLRPERCEVLVTRIEVATGVRGEFDAWRLDPEANQTALRGWREWWAEHRQAFPAGAWYWRGERIAEPTRWP